MFPYLAGQEDLPPKRVVAQQLLGLPANQLVEDPEAEFVAQALTGEEGRGGDLLGNLVEAIFPEKIFSVGWPLPSW